jgi:hypothetical protein
MPSRGQLLTEYLIKFTSDTTGIKDVVKTLTDISAQIDKFSGFAEKTGKTLEKTKKEMENTRREVQNLGAQFATAKNSLQNFERGLGSIGDFLSIMAKGIFTLGMGAFINNLAQTAARTQVLGTSLEVVGKQANLSRAYLEAQVDTLKTLGITTQAARQSLLNLMQANLSVARATDLARAAQDLAVVSGMDSSQTYERLIINIQQMDTLGLRYMGLIVRREEAEAKYALTLGRTRKELSLRERQEAFLMDTLDKASAMQGAYEAAMRDAGKQLTSMPRYIQEAKNSIGEVFLPAMLKIVLTMNKFFDSISKLEPKTRALIASGALAAAMFVTLTAAVAALTFSLGLLGGAFAYAWPVAAVAAISALAGATLYLTTTQKSNIETSREQSEAQSILYKQQVQAVDQIEEVIKWINDEKVARDDVLLRLNRLKTIIPELGTLLEEHKKKQEEGKKAVEGTSKSTDVLTDAMKKQNEEGVRALLPSLEELKKKYEALSKAQLDAAVSAKKTLLAYQEEDLKSLLSKREEAYKALMGRGSVMFRENEAFVKSQGDILKALNITTATEVNHQWQTVEETMELAKKAGTIDPNQLGVPFLVKKLADLNREILSAGHNISETKKEMVALGDKEVQAQYQTLEDALTQQRNANKQSLEDFISVEKRKTEELTSQLKTKQSRLRVLEQEATRRVEQGRDETTVQQEINDLKAEEVGITGRLSAESARLARVEEEKKREQLLLLRQIYQEEAYANLNRKKSRAELNEQERQAAREMADTEQWKASEDKRQLVLRENSLSIALSREKAAFQKAKDDKVLAAQKAEESITEIVSKEESLRFSIMERWYKHAEAVMKKDVREGEATWSEYFDFLASKAEIEAGQQKKILEARLKFKPATLDRELKSVEERLRIELKSIELQREEMDIKEKQLDIDREIDRLTTKKAELGVKIERTMQKVGWDVKEVGGLKAEVVRTDEKLARLGHEKIVVGKNAEQIERSIEELKRKLLQLGFAIEKVESDTTDSVKERELVLQRLLPLQKAIWEIERQMRSPDTTALERYNMQKKYLEGLVEQRRMEYENAELKTRGMSDKDRDVELDSRVKAIQDAQDSVDNYTKSVAYMASQTDDAFAGMGMQFRQLSKEAKSWGQIGVETATRIVGAFQNTMSDALYKVFTGDTANWRDLWVGFCQSLLKAFTDMIAEMIAQWLLMKVIVGFMGGLSLGAGEGWKGDLGGEGFVPGVTAAEGGLMKGPGTETSDSILARVSTGEYIVRAKEAKKVIPLLQFINEGGGKYLEPASKELEQGNVNMATKMIDTLAMASKKPKLALQQFKEGGLVQPDKSALVVEKVASILYRQEQDQTRKMGTSVNVPISIQTNNRRVPGLIRDAVEHSVITTLRQQGELV